MELWKKRREFCIGLLFLLIGAAYLISAFFIPEYSGYGGQSISSSFLPKVLGIMMVILSGVHAVVSYRKGPHEEVEEDDPDAVVNPNEASTKSLIMIFSVLVIYLALMPILGFILSTAIFMFASILILTPESKRNIPLALILTAVISVGVYFLFVRGLYLVLPAGILG